MKFEIFKMKMLVSVLISSNKSAVTRKNPQILNSKCIVHTVLQYDTKFLRIKFSEFHIPALSAHFLNNLILTLVNIIKNCYYSMR